MADVLLVYVPEDRAYADGIGASLERSGLTVADGGGSVQVNADAPCVLVLWSAHSTRSAMVRDAAIRAQRQGKLITAKLAGCEAPLGFARPAPHDLSQWTGDPDDPQLDPVFFAADRLVCAARLGAQQQRPEAPGGRTAPPIYPQGGHVHNPNVRPLRAGPIASIGPAAARAARVEPESASAFRAEAQPALPPNMAEEAMAWKRIENSKDPKDFLDYLAAYSPSGIFCELAQLKLDKLAPKAKPAFIPHTPSPHVEKPRAAEGTRERRAAARPQSPQPPARPEPEPPRYDPQYGAPHYDVRPEPRFEPRPDPRYEPRPEPPRYEPRHEARYDPPPTPEPRYEAPRQESRYEPRPRPRPESRDEYEFESGPIAQPSRSATNRPRRRAPAPQAPVQEQREGRGLALRPLLIVALLAAGGVAFFQALPKQSPSTEASAPGQEDLAEASRAAPLDELSDPGQIEAPAVGSGNATFGAAVDRPRPRTQAPPPAPPPQNRAFNQRAVATTPAPAAAAPPVISFRPPEPAPVTAVAPAPPPAAAPAPAPAPAAPASAAPAPAPPRAAEPTYVRPTWLRRPGAAQLSQVYPRRAADQGIPGQASLDCLIQTDGSLSCTQGASSPADAGFGEAAMRLSRQFRAAPTLPDGSSAYGKRTRLTISFAPN